MANSYKALKEEFVSNLSGSTIAEINYVTAIAPASVILWSALQSRLSLFLPYGPAAFVVDVLLNCGAILLATTLYADRPLLLNALLLAPALILYALPPPKRAKRKRLPPSAAAAAAVEASKTPQDEASASPATGGDVMEPLPKKAFLTSYRGCMMVITCVAILAVDFRVFPRRFAKTENWGTSLMDLGVGSFVFSGGLVSARGLINKRASILGQRLYTASRHSLPLLLLGFVRLYTVKGLDFAEHVTEYGLHWNFYFTLAALPPFVALFQSAFVVIPSYAILALLLGAGYQALLEFTKLKAFILVAPRTDLLSQNREGIFSFFGYLTIFLAGQATGMYAMRRNAPSGWKSDAARLLGWSGVWTLLYLLCTDYRYGLGLRASRRLANLPYCLWVAAFNCSQLAAFSLIDTWWFPPGPPAAASGNAQQEGKSVSKVLEAFNRNGLAIFLLANPLTGLVNQTVNTLDCGAPAAMGILTAYISLLAVVAVYLDVNDISIKM
ncbi:MAG: Glucosaminyl phosphatidylinositol (GlcN-PI) nositol acylation protein [Trizodia sp. TS-e1964]|nr:MAG: Glucosaminyl phosphatidylinositol (GlcN-PI) nositol acylation protein [Trizodia sp. TS-e1964]